MAKTVSKSLNPFQAAVVRLREAGARGRIEFLQGNSEPGGRGGPEIECEVGDDADPVQLAVEGNGCVDGQNLDEALELMLARLSGTKSAPAPAPAARSRK